MKIIVTTTYEEMSTQAANDLVGLMRSTARPLLCPASGDTPVGLYKELVKYYNKEKPDISKWSFVSLDEWIGMDSSTAGSCRDHLNKQLFQPLHLTAPHVCFFDGKAQDPGAECDRIEKFIAERGGIHVCVLGLGMNGHIGLNEPGTLPSLRSHVTVINPVTQQVAQKYFAKEQQLKKGITLGLSTIMESRHLFLLASGKHKAAIIKQLIEGDITPELPGSLLRKHADLRIYLDSDAAGK